MSGRDEGGAGLTEGERETARIRETYAAMRRRNARHDIQSAREEFDDWLARIKADAVAEVSARVEALLDDWGADDDNDFLEAIHDSGAWRLSRDLRAALAGAAPDAHGAGDGGQGGAPQTQGAALTGSEGRNGPEGHRAKTNRSEGWKL